MSRRAESGESIFHGGNAKTQNKTIEKENARAGKREGIFGLWGLIFADGGLSNKEPTMHLSLKFGELIEQVDTRVSVAEKVLETGQRKKVFSEHKPEKGGRGEISGHGSGLANSGDQRTSGLVLDIL